jgi:hypothetical protein
MKLLHAFLATFTLINALGVWGQDCAERPMSADARERALRVAGAYTLLQGAPADIDANVTAAQVIYDLLADNSPGADEALAALAGYSIGGAAEISCEILRRGKRILPDLIRFERCPPVLPLDASRATGRAEFAAMIEEGKHCD